MIVIPKTGFQITDPDQHDFLPPEGRAVPDTDYWYKRILDGDVTRAPPGYTPIRPIFQQIAPGTTAERPDPASPGMVRFNTDLVGLEVYLGTSAGWQLLSGLGDSVIADVLAARTAAEEAAEAAAAAAAGVLSDTAVATLIGAAVAPLASAQTVEAANTALQIQIDTLRTQLANLPTGTTPTPPPTTTPLRVPVGLTPPIINAGSLGVPIGISPPVITA
ncbi:DUF2635 domain-containing protein [Roseomonas nepalensis]|uniref:DUF2635 domain-containing protein n=1 Tax=Muricoccus nepalensis TaxID=1854500 RepID=A0A502FV32_9PROT|nr:DUF2635 domain-containing protein [Roseomonas nepalensis]TPG53281.1 DUF2635 domain-containing protein [Roseomonas nepalensis]